MNERMRESLSALLDDESNELELERILSRIGDDQELRRTWVRYNTVRSAAAGQDLAYRELDISTQVSQAIAGDRAADRGAAASGVRQRWLRPVASLAVAASVAATVVIGGQQLAQIGAGSAAGSPAAASSVSPVGLVNSLGATSVQASYGTRSIPVLQPATRTAYQELARQRMAKFMQEHAEHAALNSPGGLVPFARVPYIQE